MSTAPHLTLDPARYQLEDAVRAWQRSGHRPGVLAVIDPEGVPEAVERAFDRVGIEVARYDDETALGRCAQATPQAIVLSARACVSEPGVLVARLRLGHHLPVLLALGDGDVDVATAAIMAGAEPVLDLPLRPAPLLHHLQRVWVDPPMSPGFIQVGGLELDGRRTVAWLFGRPLDLTGAEFELLFRLAERAGRTVPRQNLWRLWPWAHDQDGTLVAAVVRLRRKLAHAGIDGAIRTVRGVGYCLDVRSDGYRRVPTQWPIASATWPIASATATHA